MARVLLEIPRVGLVMETAKVQRWLKSVGDLVAEGEPLLEVETEKTVVEIEAAAGGRLVEILVQPEEEVSVGAGIAWIENEKKEAAVTEHAPAKEPAAAAPTAVSNMMSSVEAPAAVRSDGPRISPVARKRAADHGLDIAALTGSGPGGRIQLEDVERAIAGGKPAGPRAGTGLSPVRRAVARAMTLSAAVPQFFVGRQLDCSNMEEMRKAYAAQAKLSFNDFLLHAVARTLIELPAFNAVFRGEIDSPDARIEPADGANIGLVIALDEGLVVPVLSHVERLSLPEIAREREALVERARAGRLQQQDSAPASFSISNLGTQGPERFTAMLNPPQSAILAVGRVREAPVVLEGKICIKPVCELNLTVDHRVIDGRLASKFLHRVVRALE